MNETYATERINQISWCRNILGSYTMSERFDLIRFPYAILEIKLTGLSENPGWLLDVLDTCEVTQVYKFSKFQHAMAALHPQIIPCFPHWFADFLNHSQKHFKSEFDVNSRNQDTMFIDSYIANSASAKSSRPLRSRCGTNPAQDVRNITAITPKTFYANERAFLHYSKLGTLILFILHSLPRKKSQILIMLCLICIPSISIYFIWCQIVYLRRTQKLRHRLVISNEKRRIDDTSNSVIAYLFSVLLVGVLCNINLN